MYQYTVTVKHDNGKTRFRVTAENEQKAGQQVMSAENCPPWAIIAVKETPLNSAERSRAHRFLRAKWNGHGSKAMQDLMKTPDGTRGRVIRYLVKNHGIKFI